jgi:hypothetical protein
VSQLDTVHRFQYPPHLAIINKLMEPLRTIEGIGGLAPLAIARTAARAEGLPCADDPKGLDEQLGEDFATAIELATRWPLSAMGQIQWRAVLATCARMRLSLDQYLANDGPRSPLLRPTFIVGLPRTGTTLLQYLLASAPEQRGLEFWELMRPIPKPGQWLDTFWRRLNGTLAAGLYRLVAPEYPTLHLTTARTLEECWYLFMPSYSVLNADFPMPDPAYGDWILGRDMLPAYRRYRTLLEILQHQVGPRHLVLKCPDHLWFLDCVFETFPDADVIWTHRDPAEALPSYAAQMALPARQYMGKVDPLHLGQRLTLRFRQGLERADDARQRFPQARIVDVRFAELARDPIGTTTRALATLGREVSDEHWAAMQTVLASKRPDTQGKHRYSAETYGLTQDNLHHDFADYLARFGLYPEPA